MAEREFEVFVPGRVCLFGRAFRLGRRLSQDQLGHRARIRDHCGTNQGLRARVSLTRSAHLPLFAAVDGVRQEFDIPMRADALLARRRGEASSATWPGSPTRSSRTTR